MTEQTTDFRKVDVGDQGTLDEEKVTEAYTALYTLPLKDLRVLYQKEFNVALKGKDKSRIVMRLAKKIVAKGMSADDLVAGGGNSAPSKTSGPAPEDSSESVPEGTEMTQKQAMDVLKRARSLFVEVDSLKAEKKEKMARLNKKLTEANDKMAELFRDEPSTAEEAEGAFEKLKATWKRHNTIEEKKSKLDDDYKQRIKDSSTSFRHTMMNLDQYILNFDEGDDDE